MADEPESPSNRTEAAALGELARCETLAQTATWAAQWSARLAGAEGALIWTPDAAIPIFVCVAAEGEGTRVFLRRSAPRETGTVHDLLRDRRPTALDRKDFASSQDPWVKGFPAETQTCLAIPLEAEGQVVGLLALLFEQPQKAEPRVAILKSFLRHAAPALDLALKAEKKTVGMLQAIERLTNLYDLSKAFGSTIDLEELNDIIVRKAVDFGVAEVASFWLLEEKTADVVLAGTAVNENYDVGNVPDAVGRSIVGDLLAEHRVGRRNAIPPEDPLARENEGYPIRSVLALPLLEEEKPVGALVLVNKRGRHPEFTSDDEELLQDLARQAVRALRNARQHEAEKKVEELDALLAVSREITATLDLDRVMQTIVNASAALIRYDRCAIAIQSRGKLRLGAVSGTATIDRKNPDIQRTEELLQWVFLSGSDVNVTEQEDGTLLADRPETEEKFRALFGETGLKAFYATILKDDEGKLGVLAFECREPIVFDESTRDLLAILVNQATVAVRNAQLYQQVPLAGFWKPLLEKRRKVLEIPRSRRLAWGIGAVVLAAVLFLVPWRLRIAGPARVLPGRRAIVTAGVDGIVASVRHREGELVPAGEVIATLQDEAGRASLAEARAAHEIAETAIARSRDAGNASALFEAQTREREARARLSVEEERLGNAVLRAPVGGVILTPRLEERVGQNLSRGSEFAVIGDIGTVTVEIAVPEEDSALLAVDQPLDFKLNPYPTRTFHGRVSRLGAGIREDGQARFVIAEADVENPEKFLRVGMLGKAKIRAGSRQVITLLLRKPARWFYSKLWSILP
jgi:GAF domain-containing protein/multidrug resistance efflux pump